MRLASERPVFVTGAAGFIGSHFIARILEAGGRVVAIDKMGYAADLARLERYRAGPRFEFVEDGIENHGAMLAMLESRKPGAVVHFAAESHVDRSIDAPRAFIENNTNGTFELLDACLCYWRDSLGAAERKAFRFLHVSTDEVYGSVPRGAMTEDDPLRPNSPYAASKAAAEHFVRACHVTYGLPTLIGRPGNTYGPWQFPEKLIPLMIARALDGESLPVYGDGRQVREWLYVDDHCDGIAALLERGEPGGAYNLAGAEALQNRAVVAMICERLDRVRPRTDGASYARQVANVADRPGHDLRYALDGSRTETALGWTASTRFRDGLQRTIDWYLDNAAWWQAIRRHRYRGERLGSGTVRTG